MIIRKKRYYSDLKQIMGLRAALNNTQCLQRSIECCKSHCDSIMEVNEIKGMLGKEMYSKQLADRCIKLGGYDHITVYK